MAADLIKTFYAYFAVDEDGTGTILFLKQGDKIIPTVFHEPDTRAQLEPLIEQLIQENTNRRARLVKFTTREVLADLSAENIDAPPLVLN